MRQLFSSSWKRFFFLALKLYTEIKLKIKVIFQWKSFFEFFAIELFFRESIALYLLNKSNYGSDAPHATGPFLYILKTSENV